MTPAPPYDTQCNPSEAAKAILDRCPPDAPPLERVRRLATGLHGWDMRGLAKALCRSVKQMYRAINCKPHTQALRSRMADLLFAPVDRIWPPENCTTDGASLPEAGGQEQSES